MPKRKRKHTPTSFAKDIEKTFSDCLSIVKKKNQDYSRGDDPWRNFRHSTLVGVPPERAILVRMCDKLARISNLLEGNRAVEDEKVEDTLNDLINYTAILKTYIKAHT